MPDLTPPPDDPPLMGFTPLGPVEIRILLDMVDAAMGPPTVLVPVRPAPSHADLVRVRSLLVQQLDSPEVQA